MEPPTIDTFWRDLAEFVAHLKTAEHSLASNYEVLLPISPDLARLPSALFTDDGPTPAKLGYTEIRGQYGQQGEVSYRPVPGNRTHELFERLKQGYNQLFYQSFRTRQAEADFVRSVTKLVELTTTWLDQLEKSIENPANRPGKLTSDLQTTLDNLSANIRIIITDFSTLDIPSSLKYDIMFQNIRKNFKQISDDIPLMATLKKTYPQLYRVFHVADDRTLTKKNGTNLFPKNNSRNFIHKFMLGGKRRTRRRRR